MSSSLAKQEKDLIFNLGVITSLRGLDSTGIAVGERHKRGKHKAFVLKDAESSGEFFKYKSVDQAISSASTFVLGHCRAATIGDVTAENAHPYQIGHITGAHNGTVHAYSGSTGHTDSYMLYKHLAEESIEDVVDKAKFGAYALAWFDQEDQTLNFIRNKERPLYIASSPQARTISWASEGGMLEFALKRSGLKYEDISLLPEDTLTVFDVANFAVKPAEIRQVKAKTYVSNYSSKFTPANDKKANVEELFKSLPSKPAEGGSALIPFVQQSNLVEAHKALQRPKPPEEKLPKDGFYQIAHQTWVPRHRAQGLLENGCLFCQQKSKDTEEVIWVTKHDHLCAECGDENALYRSFVSTLAHVPFRSKYHESKKERASLMNASVSIPSTPSQPSIH